MTEYESVVGKNVCFGAGAHRRSLGYARDDKGYRNYKEREFGNAGASPSQHFDYQLQLR